MNRVRLEQNTWLLPNSDLSPNEYKKESSFWMNLCQIKQNTDTVHPLIKKVIYQSPSPLLDKRRKGKECKRAFLWRIKLVSLVCLQGLKWRIPPMTQEERSVRYLQISVLRDFQTEFSKKEEDNILWKKSCSLNKCLELFLLSLKVLLFLPKLSFNVLCSESYPSGHLISLSKTINFSSLWKFFKSYLIPKLVMLTLRVPCEP